MTYAITFSPRTRIRGAGKRTFRESTAAEAWDAVSKLQASDEETEISAPNGHIISWEDLQMLAEEALSLTRSTRAR